MAMPQTRAELNQIIEEHFGLAIGAPQIANIGRLSEYVSKFDEPAPSFAQVKNELEVIKSQLEGVLPQLERTLQANIADLEKRAGTSNTQLTTSIEALEKRDQEIGAKLKTTFQQIDTQLESVQLQAATVNSMQEGIHSVVVKQQHDMEKICLDVERYVAKAIATIASKQPGQSQSGQPYQPRDGGGPKLNGVRKSEVADLTDGMTKAVFVLWRDNLDLHLEEFAEFGLGINDVLKKIRLHIEGILSRDDIQNIYGDLKGESRVPTYLIGDCDRASRELYKLLHKKLTVKLKAASVMTC